MLAGFKKFIIQGNALDLAVGIIMGLAFKTVVDALVNEVLMPIIAAIIGQPSFDDLTITIPVRLDSMDRFRNVVAAVRALRNTTTAKVIVGIDDPGRANKRWYHLTVYTDEISVPAFTLQLPAVTVNGVRSVLPPVQFRRTTALGIGPLNC